MLANQGRINFNISQGIYYHEDMYKIYINYVNM